MREAIERLSQELQQRSPIDVDGVEYSVRVSNHREPLPFETQLVRISIEAVGGGTTHRGEIGIGTDRVTDLNYVTEAAINTMRSIIKGELLPGTRELL